MNTASLHLLPRAAHPNGARCTSSRGGRCFPQGSRLLSTATQDFARADLLPGNGEYGRPSPPPEGCPPKRRPPHLLPRRALFPKGSRLLSMATQNFARADLLPGDGEYGRPSPPPEGWPPKRHPPVLPRRVLFFQALFAHSPARKHPASIAIAPASDYLAPS